MSNENPLTGVERRDFLKIMSLTCIGSLVYSKELIASKLSASDVSNVVVIYNQNVTNTTKKTVDAAIVQSMVNQAITAYTGISEVGEAWKSIFPGITTNNIIALKVNTLFPTNNNGTHPQIAYAVANGLTQMDFAGTIFPANNIIIFDFYQNYLSAKGYAINTSNTGIRCFPSPAYSADTYDVAGIKVRLSTVITQMADYLVNIAYLKSHFLSGVSHCLKNHYGSLQNPEISPLFHDNGKCGDPYIPAITALDPIKSKQKFCIIDALYGVANSGPDGPVTCAPNKIIMGQDVVAVDCTGRNLIKSVGLSQYDLNRTTHIDTAAKTYLLGTNDPNNINVIDLTNTATAIGSMQEQSKKTELLQNYPNPFTTETNIRFNLASNEHVQFTIRDYTGKEIIQLVNKTLNQGMHQFTWNGRNASGKEVLNNIFIGELKTESYNRSIIIQKIR